MSLFSIEEQLAEQEIKIKKLKDDVKKHNKELDNLDRGYALYLDNKQLFHLINKQSICKHISFEEMIFKTKIEIKNFTKIHWDYIFQKLNYKDETFFRLFIENDEFYARPPNDRTCPVCYNNYLYSINPTTFKKREKKFKNCIHTVCHNCYNNIKTTDEHKELGICCPLCRTSEKSI